MIARVMKAMAGLAALWLAANIALAAPPAQMTECDMLAASPLDRKRPESIPGVSFDRIDAAKAVPACERALKGNPNDPRLKFQLARSLGKAKKDLERQAILYREAAERGYALAAHNLATLYESGAGVRQDQVEAVRLLRQAAEAGVVLAMRQLGKHLWNGSGTEKDEAEAVSWYRKAAEGGDVDAMDFAASAYEGGFGGFPRDDSEAKRWYEKAAAAGSQSARSLLTRRAELETLTPKELTGLQRQFAAAHCYSGPLDGTLSPALNSALATCPDPHPRLRIETGMHVAASKRIATDKNCRMLASGSDDKSVRLWAMPEGRLVRTQRLPIGEGLAGRVNAVAITDDGSFVAAGGYDAASERSNTTRIYLFDAATGASIRRIGTFESAIAHLAFSPDGQRLAAALSEGQGIRVIDVSSGRELMADRNFGGKHSYGVAFGPKGELYAVGDDGFLRRYTVDLRPETRVATAGGKQPFSLTIDPSGRRLAIGYNDSPAVDLYETQNLRLISAADTKDLNKGSLPIVAWSRDGKRLYAAGRYFDQNVHTLIRQFTEEGRRAGADASVSDNTILSLAPCGGGVAFSTSDLFFGLLMSDGRTIPLATGHAPDMRGKVGANFTVSADGLRLRFGLGKDASVPILFDLGNASLAEAPTALPELVPPDTAGLPVTKWEDYFGPRFNDNPLPLYESERSRSLAVRSDKAGFVLGSEYRLRSFDKMGNLRWQIAVPGVAWGVNLARNDEVILAAYGDGTIR